MRSTSSDAVLRSVLRTEPGQQARLGEGYVRGPLGLWVPPAYAGPRAAETPAAARFLVTTVGWSELFGPATRDDLVARVRRYSLRELAAWVARISLALRVGEGTDYTGNVHATQDFLLRGFLGPGPAARLWDRVRQVRGDDYEPGRVGFFQERQALNLFKVALLVLDVDAPDTGETVVPFLEALLMMHDLMDAEFDGLDLETNEGREKLELYAYAGALHYAGTHDLHDQVRAHYLYVDPPASVVARAGAADVRAMLERSTGLPADVAWNALFGVYTAWGTRSEEDLADGRIAESRAGFFSTLGGVSPQQRERWFGLATSDIADLRARARERYTLDALRPFDLLVFEQTPVVAFGDTLFCLSLPFLKRLGTTGLQHRFLDGRVFDAKEREAFLRTRGEAVERYVLDLLERTFGTRLVGEARLREIADGRPVCDAVVVYPDAAILIEVKAAHPTLAARHAEGYAAFRETWRRHIREKAAPQLDSTAALIAEGRLRAVGVDPATVRRLYPVVVTFEHAATAMTYRAVRDVDLAGHPLMARIAARTVAPLTLMDIRDVEEVEVAVEHGADVAALLREKTADPGYVELPFDDYLRVLGVPYLGRHSRWHAERFRQIAAERLALFRNLGLPSSDNGRHDEADRPAAFLDDPR